MPSPVFSSVYPVVEKFAADGVALFLLLALHVCLNFGNCFAMVVGAGVDGIKRVGQQKFVLAGFSGIGVRGVFQGAQLGLKFGIGFDDNFQRLANIILAAHVHLDAGVQFVVDREEVFHAVLGLAPPRSRLL